MGQIEETVLTAFAVLCVIGLISNLAAFYYSITALRNVQKSLFILLMADSVTSMVGLLTFLLICFIIHFDAANETICAMFFVSLHTPSAVGIAATAQIAIIRYVGLIRAVKHRPLKDRHLVLINVATVFALFGLLISVAAFHVANDLPLAIISEACFKGATPRPLHVASKIYGIVPLVLFLLVSVIFDYLILQFVRTTVIPTTRTRNDHSVSSISGRENVVSRHPAIRSAHRANADAISTHHNSEIRTFPQRLVLARNISGHIPALPNSISEEISICAPALPNSMVENASICAPALPSSIGDDTSNCAPALPNATGDDSIYRAPDLPNVINDGNFSPFRSVAPLPNESLKTVRKYSSRVVNLVIKSSNETSYEAIPARATLLSALTLVPYLAIGLTVSLHAIALGPSMSATIIGVIALILNGVRFPLASLITFAGKGDVRGESDDGGARRTRAKNELPTRRNLKMPEIKIDREVD